ncbi:MAG TPA: tRNA (cytosine(32)/uridine(32)-2'-O)-methyltransferase TrmJ [Oceanospirillaceae bacterium]|nr:tRNA (cytosine(32)/uridine(32)-2'-O)-methyltransferase TrmJ [Oceanospirillaceae bacterium]
MQNLMANARIVLVNTSHPGNIGGVARAMKNMGVHNLVLVDPQEFPSGKADARSAGAKDVLKNATIVPTLEQAIEGCGLVVGTSARSRNLPWPLLDPKETAAQAIAELPQHQVAFVFGREDRGLTNEELHLCNFHVHIPSNEDFSSLNLAAAVQVITYELRMAHLALVKGDAPKPVWGTDWDEELATSEQMERLFEHMEETLVEIEFFDPKYPRQLLARLRRLFLRARLDRIEHNIVRGMFTATQRTLKKLR